MEETPKRVRVRYTRAEGYRVVAANGAWGGIGQHGTVHFDLYVERPRARDAVLRAGEDRITAREDPEDPGAEPTIDRESQVGVVLSVPAAQALTLWLFRQLQTLEQAEGASEEDSGERDAGI